MTTNSTSRIRHTLDASSCQLPTSVPTAVLTYTALGFFIISTIAILAFMKYDDTRARTNTGHKAEVDQLLKEINTLKSILSDREKQTEDKVKHFLDSIKNNQPVQTNKQPYSPPVHKEWKRVREPVQLEGGIDDGYELVEIK